MENTEIAQKQPTQLAITTGFLDQVAIENETVCLSGWVLSFESEPIDNFKILFSGKQFTEFELTQGLPSPGVKKAHPNIDAANNARFIIRVPMSKQQQQQLKDALMILIPLVKNREGEPLLNAVTPSLSPLIKTSEPNLPPQTPQVELISVHVPKAAGTAFRQVLLQAYGTQGVLTDKTNMFEDNMPATIPWQTKVIEGHFRAGKYDKLFPNAQRITWLRQPIRRLISDYCFRHISNPTKDHLNKEALLKFAQSNSNLMAYCVNRKSLDYFEFVGITEYFEQDLLDLKNILGWPDYQVIYQNRNPYPEYVAFQKEVLSDKKLMDELATANTQDMELYEAALSLRKTRGKKLSLRTLPLQQPKTLATVGNLEEALVQNQQLRLSGWVASFNSGAVDGFQVTIAGQEFTEFTADFGLPSPDVKKPFPNLDSAEVARFRIVIPLSQTQLEQFQNSVVALTPLFKGRKGFVMVKVIPAVGGGNKSVNYQIVNQDKNVDAHVILPDGKSVSFPPKNLVTRVQGNSQINDFLQAGWQISKDIKAALKKIGKDFSEFESVLDFGCGCGRVIIWNGSESNSTSLYGTDIDAEAISWCQQNIKFAKFNVNQALPPLPYEDNQFDLIYLISVFTNFQEEMQLKWLQELQRITKPGGIVIITTRLLRSPKEAVEMAAKLAQEGLVCLPASGHKNVFPDWYTITLQTEDYVRNKWVDLFEIIDYIPGGIRGNQNIVLLGNNLKQNLPVSPLVTTALPETQEQSPEEQMPETKLLATTGYLEEVGFASENELSIKGWVAAANSGSLESLKVAFGDMEIHNFELKTGIPSPDVKKIYSHLDAETARFELSIALNPEQIEQCQDSYISLTPIFKQGEGTVLVQQLALSRPQSKNEKISDNQIPTEQLPTVATPQLLSLESPTQELEAQAPTVATPQPPSPESVTQEKAEPQPPSPESVIQEKAEPKLLSPESPKHQEVEEVGLSSSVLEKIKADLQRSQTEIQQLQADLERFKSKQQKTLEIKLPVEPDTHLQGLGDQTPTKKKILTKPVEQVVQKQKLPNPPPEQKQELLGLSGVTVAKFWEIIEGRSKKEEVRRDDSKPAISILTPTWNSSLDWFVETVLSVLNQSIHNWEWCIVDDGSKQPEIRNVLAGLAEKEPRLKVRFSEQNGGISAATNKALNLATGEYICLLDHDDTLTPTALEDSLNKLAEGFDVVYSDEDKIDFSGLNYIHPFFKPDWSPEYFRGVMYVGHLLCVRRELALAAGGFKSEFDGVQDYEFMLRVSEQTHKIAHISKHLYHWRQVKGSISGDADAKAGIETVQQAAVNAHLKRIGLAAKPEPGLGRHRVNINPLPQDNYPLMSLIIATPNISENLGECLENLLSVSTYPNNEVILVGGNETDNIPDNIRQNPAVKVLCELGDQAPTVSGNFNYSRAYNLGAKTAQGEYLVFLNTNVEVAVEDWQRHLLYYAEQSDVGAVGGLLNFPDGKVEHAGIVLGKAGKVNYVMRGFSSDHDGYAGSLVCAREVSAVSRDCLMVTSADFETVGGFNEHFFNDYQDVDLCLKLRKNGKRIVFTPRSVLINHESAKHREGNYDVVDYMLLLDQRQVDMDLGDPYYNLNFDIQRNDYSVVL